MTPDLTRQPLALYDMDRTITRRGTLAAFLAFVLARRQGWRALMLPLVGVAALGYAGGLLTRGRLKEISLTLLIGARYDAGELARISADYAGHVLAANARSAALSQIAADRAAGYRVVLATASVHLYVDAIAQRLGIDDVIATALEPGRARLAGPNCYGTDKRALIDAWMAREGLAAERAHIRAYSDHVSDAPMLELADEPFAVSPSPALRSEAAVRGWPVLEWD